MAKTSKRAQIVALKEAGHSARSVAKLLGACKQTVYNVMKRLKQTGSVSTKPIPCRPRAGCTKKLVDAVRKKVFRSPRRSMCKLAKDHGVSSRTMKRIIKDDLGLESHKMQRRHLILAASKDNWLHRAKKMLERINSAGDKAFTWSDETIFTVEPQISQQNDRILADGLSGVDPAARTVFRRQKPADVMVWAAVASDVSQQWCKTHMTDFCDKDMWPPSSPDLDFAIWSILGTDVCATPHSNTANLKLVLQATWCNLDEGTVRRSCLSALGRFEAVVKARGVHIE